MTRDERDKIVSELANHGLKGKTRWDIVNALDSVVEKAAKAGVCFNDSSLGCAEVILPISKYCFFDPETCGYSEPLHKDPNEGSAAQAKVTASEAIDAIRTLRDRVHYETNHRCIDTIELELEAKDKEIKRLTEENSEPKKEKNYTVNHGYEEYLESYVDEYQKDIEYLNDKLSKIKDIL